MNCDAKLFHKGFSLIEVHISIFILSIGVIGAAGLQLAAFRAERQAAIQTAALQLATEISDVVRAIGRRRPATAGSSPVTGLSYQSAFDGDPQVPAKLCYSARCNIDELTEFEIYEWKARVKASLPGGRLLICHDSAPWDNGKKSLSWACHGDTNGQGPLVVKLGWQAQNPDGSPARSENGSFAPGLVMTVGPSRL
ncbi:MAG TPA: type IV pilus modification protein PilV [Noviherbaspirillum sp.]|uniref:type IV pilus modification protein PilV n=1 Tax=Noviherbaspirillum sp. TaxID=1926288 RepID=UPI002B495645|nr:type IV pilus modification protein PilV [Noviherbaspirillum sp.]HJV85879.1 type IV pilus modification protein PilV [Noviherbaspirillum sp.]